MDLLMAFVTFSEVTLCLVGSCMKLVLVGCVDIVWMIEEQ
jgi:hypothetical protein